MDHPDEPGDDGPRSFRATNIHGISGGQTARGVCYRASPLFTRLSENFSRGLNERTPVSNSAPAIDYYRSVFRDLSR
jgi:hypothetical protein